ncbi:MAG: pyrroline-5-carboxylate reductase [Bacteroidales bacterium]|jgi:pyrroline-5-carboxylate reductase|nr:pyrroline-5-carboxylate reductase [Bacteroidales bacterium]
MNITVIGSGNIGSALVNGLLRRGISPENITMADINREALAVFASKGVIVTQDNVEAVKSADMIVLCVKPYLVQPVIEGFLPALSAQAVLISVAAGITLEQLSRLIGKRALFRVIPNTAMAVNQSMTCIAAENASPEQEKAVLDLFGLVGKTAVIDESLMNAATVIASCGTAFALRYLRAATVAGIELGFRPDLAVGMVAQTMSGAAALIAESGCHPEQEIDKVTTPKGITIKGLNELEHAGFSSAVIKGILAAYSVFEK